MGKSTASRPKKVIIKDWLIVLVALLDDVAALVLVFLVLWFFEIRIPLPVTIVIALSLGAVIFIVHKAIVPSFHRRIVTGSEGMIGLEGKVIEPLTLCGIIRVEGEYWQARSVDGEIAAGEAVEILRVSSFTLEVRRKSQ